MDLEDVFASAQIVTQHPVLMERAELRCQYYAYLKKLIRLNKCDRQKYAKANLSFYKATLCGDNIFKNPKEWDEIRHCIYLLPFDAAAILASINWINTNIPSTITKQMMLDFKLPKDHRELLNWEFHAALGDKETWTAILRRKYVKQYEEYLRLVQENVFFTKERPFKILITSTMSAGKSTLINALVGKNVSLMQNIAATGKIHTIISKPFEDGVTTEYDSEISIDATREELLTDNENNKTAKIIVSTYFDGLLGGQRVILYDSPGVNSSENPVHAEITRKTLKAKKYKLVLYVLNATQLGTTDDEQHLKFVSETIGKRKCLFVMNKIDRLVSEDESLPDIIARQKAYLKQHGFKNPIICPVSTRAAYLTKKSRHEDSSRSEQREMENYVDMFAQSGLAEYYENELGCSAVPMTGKEVDDLYRNCGFAYLENIIIRYKEKET